MEANRLLSMIGKLVIVTLFKELVQAWSKSARPAKDGEPPGGPSDEAEKTQTAQARQLEKRTKDAMRMFRRIGR